MLIIRNVYKFFLLGEGRVGACEWSMKWGLLGEGWRNGNFFLVGSQDVGDECEL
jgi:hypothetical protein